MRPREHPRRTGRRHPRAAPPPRRARTPFPETVRARLRGDRGSVTTEMVAAFPLLMLLIAAAVQFGMWGLGQLGAQQAANHALQTTRVADGTTTAGRADAAALLSGLTGAFIEGETVTVTRTADTATVTIRGHAPILFGITIPVHSTVSGPVEAFRPSGHTPGGQP